jgi:hypothetical protein
MSFSVFPFMRQWFSMTIIRSCAFYPESICATVFLTRFGACHMNETAELIQTVVALPAGVRKACERRAAAERRSLSSLLRNVISDHVGDDAGKPAMSAGAR